MEYTQDQHIGVYKNAFSNEWCENIIKYFEYNSQNYHSRDINSGVRDTSCFLDDKDLINEFYEPFTTCIDLYRYQYSYMPQSIKINDYKIQKTLPTEGYHPYHIENNFHPREIYRVAAWTVYLNDVEEAGETEFLYQLKRINPQKGTLCIFPSGYTHVHRGNTPFSGEKYIMTGWLEAYTNNDGDKLR